MRADFFSSLFTARGERLPKAALTTQPGSGTCWQGMGIPVGLPGAFSEGRIPLLPSTQMSPGTSQGKPSIAFGEAAPSHSPSPTPSEV